MFGSFLFRIPHQNSAAASTTRSELATEQSCGTNPNVADLWWGDAFPSSSSFYNAKMCSRAFMSVLLQRGLNTYKTSRLIWSWIWIGGKRSAKHQGGQGILSDMPQLFTHISHFIYRRIHSNSGQNFWHLSRYSEKINLGQISPEKLWWCILLEVSAKKLSRSVMCNHPAFWTIYRGKWTEMVSEKKLSTGAGNSPRFVTSPKTSETSNPLRGRKRMTRELCYFRG